MADEWARQPGSSFELVAPKSPDEPVGKFDRYPSESEEPPLLARHSDRLNISRVISNRLYGIGTTVVALLALDEEKLTVCGFTPEEIEEIKQALGEVGLELGKIDLPPYPEADDPRREILIEELEISVRSYNALKRVGFSNVGDILDEWPLNDPKVKNLGHGKGFFELIEALTSLGLYMPTLKEWRKWQKSITALKLTPLTSDRLYKARIFTIGDLVRMSRDELDLLLQFEEAGLDEIEQKLEAQGLALQPSTP
jgi:DNA-directed RNA polymerase alpha subunit